MCLFGRIAIDKRFALCYKDVSRGKGALLGGLMKHIPGSLKHLGWYEPVGENRLCEVESYEMINGEVVISVGGIPVLFFNNRTKSV